MQIRQLTTPNRALFTLTQTCRYLNCCCNFFLYSTTSSLFRRELREIFHCSRSSIKHEREVNILQTVPFTGKYEHHHRATNLDNVMLEKNS